MDLETTGMRPLALLPLLSLVSFLAGSCASDSHRCGTTCCPNCCPKGSGVAEAATSYGGRDGAGWAAAAEPPDGEMRQESAEALAAIGPVCLCRATGMLDSPDAGVRTTGVEAIRRIGPEAHPAAEKLGAALRDRAPQVKIGAARALAALGPGAASELPELVDALEDEVWEVRYHSVIALGHVGWRAFEHRHVLGEIEHHDRHERVRRSATVSREQIEEDWLLHSRGIYRR